MWKSDARHHAGDPLHFGRRGTTNQDDSDASAEGVRAPPRLVRKHNACHTGEPLLNNDAPVVRVVFLLQERHLRLRLLLVLRRRLARDSPGYIARPAQGGRREVQNAAGACPASNKQGIGTAAASRLLTPAAVRLRDVSPSDLEDDAPKRLSAGAGGCEDTGWDRPRAAAPRAAGAGAPQSTTRSQSMTVGARGEAAGTG